VPLETDITVNTLIASPSIYRNDIYGQFMFKVLCFQILVILYNFYKSQTWNVKSHSVASHPLTGVEYFLRKS